MAPVFSMTTDLAGQKKLAGPLFEAFQAAGFTAVHWCQDWKGEAVFYSEEFARQVRQLADHCGLRVADIHGYSGTSDGITYTDELFVAANINRAEFAARIGAGTVVLHLPMTACKGTEAIDSSIDRLRAIRKPFEKLGVRAAVENGNQTPGFFDALFAEFDAGYLGFCYDSGHAVVGGQEGLLARHIDRLLVTHLHDNDGTADQHRLPGLGKADWPGIVRTLKASRYAGTVNLELNMPAGEELGAFCKKGYEILTRLWNGKRRVCGPTTPAEHV